MSDVPSVAASFAKIRSWLSANAPKISANLNPPATADALAAAEDTLGHKMPEAWHELYRQHDGMNTEPNLGSLFFGMQFLQLEAALAARNQVDDANPNPVRRAEDGIRTEDINNPMWLPFASDCSSTLLQIDLDPASGGALGQVIFTDHDADTVILVAPSLASFLGKFVEDLEGAKYFLNEEALAEDQEFLSCEPEIDIVNWSFSPRWKHLAR